MRNIREQNCATAICNLAKFLPLYTPWIGRKTGDDHLRLMLFCQLHHMFKIDLLRFFIYAVGNDVVQFSGSIYRRSMGQVAAVHQVHTHYRLTRFDQCMVDSVVRRCSRKRLHIYKYPFGRNAIGGESRRSTPLSQCLDDIDIFNTFVVPAVGVAAVMSKNDFAIVEFILHQPQHGFRWITFGIDILKRRSQCFPHRHWSRTFRWNKN